MDGAFCIEGILCEILSVAMERSWRTRRGESRRNCPPLPVFFGRFSDLTLPALEARADCAFKKFLGLGSLLRMRCAEESRDADLYLMLDFARLSFNCEDGRAF